MIDGIKACGYKMAKLERETPWRRNCGKMLGLILWRHVLRIPSMRKELWLIQRGKSDRTVLGAQKFQNHCLGRKCLWTCGLTNSPTGKRLCLSLLHGWKKLPKEWELFTALMARRGSALEESHREMPEVNQGFGRWEGS